MRRVEKNLPLEEILDKAKPLIKIVQANIELALLKGFFKQMVEFLHEKELIEEFKEWRDKHEI